MDKKKQLDLFKADISFFHFFKELVRSKIWASMSAATCKLYPVIKSYSNHDTGESFPSITTLEEYSGLSRPSITKALKELENLGYIRSEKRAGKHTLYTLVEKFSIADLEGDSVATASFDYLPSMVKKATTELQNFISEGLPNAEGKLQYIHIEKLTLQVANNMVNGNQINGIDSKTLFKGIQDKLAGKTSVEVEALDTMIEQIEREEEPLKK